MAKKLQLGFDIKAGTLTELGDKPNGEKIVSYLSDFKGQRYFNIRAIYAGADGKWLPGKGLAVPANMMGMICQGISQLDTNYTNVTPIKAA